MLQEKFPKLSAGVFDGPQTRQFLNDPNLTDFPIFTGPIPIQVAVNVVNDSLYIVQLTDLKSPQAFTLLCLTGISLQNNALFLVSLRLTVKLLQLLSAIVHIHWNIDIK